MALIRFHLFGGVDLNTSSIVTNWLKLKFRKCIIILAMILVTLNGMIPASLPVQAMEETGMEEPELPNVSKDVDGKEGKEVQKGIDYHYNVKVQLPKNISGYETMTISDDLDKRLAVLKTVILINGEVDDRFKAVVEDQKVSLKLTQEQLQELVGKEIKLQLTTQVKGEATTGDKISNISTIMINNHVVMETNPAVVTLVGSEEKQREEPDASKEDTSIEDTSKEDGEKNVESNDDSPVKKSADALVNQVQANNDFTITSKTQRLMMNQPQLVKKIYIIMMRLLWR